MQKCLRRMKDGDPTSDADFAQTLWELAQKPYLCALIPGLRNLRQPLDHNADPTESGKGNSKREARRSAMYANESRNLHPGKRGRGHHSSSISPKNSQVSSTASDAHSATEPASATPPAKQQHVVPDPEYGEDLPEGDDDKVDDDDDQD